MVNLGRAKFIIVIVDLIVLINSVSITFDKAQICNVIGLKERYNFSLSLVVDIIVKNSPTEVSNLSSLMSIDVVDVNFAGSFLNWLFILDH